MEKFDKYLKQINKSRQEIKYNRKKFWSKNKVDFMNNLKTLVSNFPNPAGWRVNIVASCFLLDKEGISMPYDDDVWSFVDIVGATEKQGKDLVVFFNKSDLEFLSAPALLPLIVHEMKHVEQAAIDPEKYIKTGVDDKLNQQFEVEAEAEVEKISDEFRKQNILEKVMYSYDKKGWKGAKKMVNYLHLQSKDAFGGGYNQDMHETEYKLFLEAEDEKDIDIFIDYFIEGFVKTLKEDRGEIKLNLVKEERLSEPVKDLKN
jgi:hypothetical protein